MHPATGMPGSRIVRMQLLWLALAVVCLWLIGCDNSSSDPLDDVVEQGGQRQSILMELWSELRPDATEMQLPPVHFPADLSPHPHAPAESFQLRAILSGAGGSLMSVQLQLDRLALDVAANADSDWGFSEIMRSSVVTGKPGETALEARETVERLALGLADSDQNSLHVIDTRLDYQRLAGKQRASDSPTRCAARYHLSTGIASAPVGSPEFADLDVSMSACPEALSLQGLNQWQASALATTATLRGAEATPADGSDMLWQGHAWLSQTWGNLPSANGAVLIDQLDLRLTKDAQATAQLLSVSRSKRRTGRGPQTVQATLTSLTEDARVLDLQWIDEGEQLSPISGMVYPQRMRIRSEDESVDLLLTPMVALPEISDSLGVRWSGAVMVSGTHTGVGFLDFQPLTGSGNNATSGR